MEYEMMIQSDYVKYHQSISAELKATQNRIRNLIGSKHWLTDGEHKETILRKVLKNRLPETCRIGSGFICFMDGPSTQQDILITDSSKPTLYKEGDLTFVTSDTVQAMVEVKTTLNNYSQFIEVLNKLADQVCRVREADIDNINHFNSTEIPWAGLYIFDQPKTPKGGDRTIFLQQRTQELLRAVSEASQNNIFRVINYIAMGPDVFIRFWNTRTQNVEGHRAKPRWKSYIFDRPPHKGLAPAYFIGNLIMDITSEESLQARYAWFPIQDNPGKERYKTHWIELGGNQVHTYQNNTIFPEG